MTYLKEGTSLQGGKYRIEKVLGQGGFGITYLGEHIGLRRKVAIKEFFMKEHCNREQDTSHVTVPSVGSKDLVERFRQKFVKEAQTISDLENRHIVRIHDVFEEQGTAYYVMEYLPGGDLRSRIPKNGMKEAEALSYIRQIADALLFVHERNILHLDVKPGNVLFRSNGEAVLVDFGLSKHYDESSGEQTSSTPLGISEGYAPTEQYESSGVSSFSPATDIYSLGATFYCLLQGSRPPKASVVLNDGLPVLPISVSSTTCKAIVTAMQPRRNDRPQSIDAFLSMFETPLVEKDNDDEDTVVIVKDDEGMVVVNPPITLVSHSSSKRKKYLAPILICLVAILCGFGLSQCPWTRDDRGDSLSSDTLVSVVDTVTSTLSITEETVQAVEENTEGVHKQPEKKQLVSWRDKYEKVMKTDQSLQPNYYVFKDGRWGIVSKGREIIPCIYEEIQEIQSNTVYAMKNKGKWGVLRNVGGMYVQICGLEYDKIMGDHWRDDILFGFKGTLIDAILCRKENNTIIYALPPDANYEIIDQYLLGDWSKDGGAVFAITENKSALVANDIQLVAEDIIIFDNLLIVKNNGFYGVIDRKGQTIIPFKYQDIESFWGNGSNIMSEKYLAVMQGGQFGIIDFSENIVVPFEYDWIGGNYDNYTQCIKVKKNGKFGGINIRGEIVLPLIYDDFYIEPDWGNNAVWVTADGKKIYIDNNGLRDN